MSFWVKLCGQLAPMFAVVVFMAPIPTILKVNRDQTVGDLPLLPYSSMISSAFVWVAYGTLLSEPRVWVANSIGLVLGCCYFLAFIRHVPSSSPQKSSSTLPGTVLQHMQGASALILLCLVLCIFSTPVQVGNLGVILCVCMFASPLAALKVVLQTRSAKAIPLPFTIASVLNCFLWSVTGLFDMMDYAIYVPNLLGLSFGLLQVALKVVYGSGSTPKDGSLPLISD